MRFIKKSLIFLLILSCLWIAALIVQKQFKKPISCLSEEVTTTHPDYVKCGPEVEKHLHNLADSGDIQAMYKLALMYDSGDRIPENRSEAIKWMQKAENANLPDAQYVTAVWAERGYFGENGSDLAIPLYTAAARQGHINAMKSLANIYHDTDPEKSSYWMKRIQNQQ